MWLIAFMIVTCIIVVTIPWWQDGRERLAREERHSMTLPYPFSEPEYETVPRKMTVPEYWEHRAWFSGWVFQSFKSEYVEGERYYEVDPQTFEVVERYAEGHYLVYDRKL